MVVKLYLSGISGNKEVKKKQQRVQMILDSKSIRYESIDITEPGREKDKETMQQKAKTREVLGKHPLPPQIFNDDEYCGDYEDFDMANEVDELEMFLRLPIPSKLIENDTTAEKVNGSRESDESQGVRNGAKTTEVNGDVELTSIIPESDSSGPMTDVDAAATQENAGDDAEVITEQEEDVNTPLAESQEEGQAVEREVEKESEVISAEPEDKRPNEVADEPDKDDEVSSADGALLVSEITVEGGDPETKDVGDGSRGVVEAEQRVMPDSNKSKVDYIELIAENIEADIKIKHISGLRTEESLLENLTGIEESVQGGPVEALSKTVETNSDQFVSSVDVSDRQVTGGNKRSESAAAVGTGSDLSVGTALSSVLPVKVEKSEPTEVADKESGPTKISTENKDLSDTAVFKSNISLAADLPVTTAKVSGHSPDAAAAEKGRDLSVISDRSSDLSTTVASEQSLRAGSPITNIPGTTPGIVNLNSAISVIADKSSDICTTADKLPTADDSGSGEHFELTVCEGIGKSRGENPEGEPEVFPSRPKAFSEVAEPPDLSRKETGTAFILGGAGQTAERNDDMPGLNTHDSAMKKGREDPDKQDTGEKGNTSDVSSESPNLVAKEKEVAEVDKTPVASLVSAGEELGVEDVEPDDVKPLMRRDTLKHIKRPSLPLVKPSLLKEGRTESPSQATQIEKIETATQGNCRFGGMLKDTGIEKIVEDNFQSSQSQKSDSQNRTGERKIRPGHGIPENSCQTSPEVSSEHHEGVPTRELMTETFKPFSVDKIAFSPQLISKISSESNTGKSEKGVALKSWNRRPSEVDLVKQVRFLLDERDADIAYSRARQRAGRSPMRDPHRHFLTQINQLINDIVDDEEGVDWPVVPPPKVPTPPPEPPVNEFLQEVLRALNAPYHPKPKPPPEETKENIFLKQVKGLLNSEKLSGDGQALFFSKERGPLADNEFVHKVRVILDERESSLGIERPHTDIPQPVDHSVFLDQVLVLLNDEPITKEQAEVKNRVEPDEEEDTPVDPKPEPERIVQSPPVKAEEIPKETIKDSNVDIPVKPVEKEPPAPKEEEPVSVVKEIEVAQIFIRDNIFPVIARVTGEDFRIFVSSLGSKKVELTTSDLDAVTITVVEGNGYKSDVAKIVVSPSKF